MTAEEVKARIESGIAGAQAQVETDGHHYEALVVADAFRGLPRVRQHQLVYGLFQEELKGAIHALALKTFTPEAWDDFRRSQGL
jgi:acid stress-induced BolA-like protein IbaG/YrbA